MMDGAVGCLLFVWGRVSGDKVEAMIIGIAANDGCRCTQRNDTREEGEDGARDRRRVNSNRCEWWTLGKFLMCFCSSGLLRGTAWGRDCLGDDLVKPGWSDRG